MHWKLVGISEPLEGQSIAIERDMVIGRHQQADIVLQAGHISRRHAALLLKENGRQLWIQDLQSSNGTFVNGQKITEQQLKNLDEINFETICLQVRVEHVAESAEIADVTEQLMDLSSFDKIVPADEGMPTLEQRGDVEVSREGMPTHMNVPKPAPIPEHIDVKSTVENKVVASVSENRVANTVQAQKNSKVGLISIVVLIILMVLAGLTFLAK